MHQSLLKTVNSLTLQLLYLLKIKKMETILYNFKRLFTFIMITTYIFVNSQTFDETTRWISSKSDQQIFYDSKNKKIDFVRVYNFEGPIRAVSNSLNPHNIVSVSISKDIDGKYNLELNFKKTGTLVRLSTYDQNKQLSSSTQINMYGLSIYFGVDMNMITRLKTAFIHMFKTIGIEIKDGDIF